jgi:hypothetical protein
MFGPRHDVCVKKELTGVSSGQMAGTMKLVASEMVQWSSFRRHDRN